MWITSEIDLPEDIVSALHDKRLVVFAGAGVSKSPPASFPNFDELAKQVYEQTGRLVERQSNETVDRYFGRLKKGGVAVHQLVSSLLSNPASQPTELHHNLVSLYSSAQVLRLVTTNFDRHFTTAGRELFGRDLEVYIAPALPLGRKFSGLVYLHGSVEHPADELVLTDEDFGHAYLTDGWATRFLHAMFSNYTVLFVGYSHGDPVMQYLARGLPPGTKRYVLAPKDNSGHWQHLDITPVEYSLRPEPTKHGALSDGVKAWVERERMGFGDHEQRIKTIVGTSPPLEPRDVDYILSCLKQVSTLRFFTAHAVSPQWLQWAADMGVLDRLFKPAGDIADTDGLLADWIVRCFACLHPDAVLAILEQRRQQLHSSLWFRLAHHLSYCDPRPDAATLATWVGVLLHSPPPEGNVGNWLDYVLNKCRFPEDAGTALLLFDFLLAPQIELKPSWPALDDTKTPERSVRVDLSVRGDHYWLTKTWADYFRPHLDLFAGQLIPIVTKHLQQAHILLRQTGYADDLYDPTSFRRKAIEPHDQDKVPDDFGPLITAARDLIDHLLSSNVVHADSIVDMWLSSGVPLTKRLSIYAISRHPRMTADEKLQWLLTERWLYTHGLKHEVFQLLKAAYATAGEGMRNAVLEEALRGPNLEGGRQIEEKTLAYETYNLICWLAQVAPSCEATSAKLRLIQEANPEFKPREKWLDFDSWGESGWGGTESPITVDELLKKPVSETVDLLVNFKGEMSPGPDRYGLMGAIRAAASKNFDWGWDLASVLREKHEWKIDLWTAVLDAWSDIILDEGQWRMLLGLVKKTPEIYACDYAVSRLLLRGVERDAGGLPHTLLPEAEVVAENFFASIQDEATHESARGDWLQTAINHAGGRIVQFWLYALSIRRRAAGDLWREVPENYRRCFSKVIEGDSVSSHMGVVILTSEIAFSFALDQEWTRRNVMPLLDWSSNAERAQYAWHGLLWAKLNKALLPELWPFFEQSYRELSRGLESRRDRFCELMAEIAVFASENPISEGWLFKFVKHVENRDRERWGAYVEHVLRCSLPEARRKVWETWLDDYWCKRQSGIPLSLSDEETRKMIEWVGELEIVFPSVVDRICQKPAPDMKQSSVYFDLEKKKVAKAQPAATSKLLVHLLTGARDPFYHCDDAKKIAEELADSGVSASELKTIREHLLRLGCV